MNVLRKPLWRWLTTICLLLLIALYAPVRHRQAQEEALFVGAQTGDIRQVRCLLDSGVDINAVTIHHKQAGSGQTALMLAAAYDRTQVIQLLLERGADVNYVGTSGRTALMAAAESGDREDVQLLLQAGANIHAQTAYGATVWDAAKGRPEIVKLLDQAGTSH